MRGTDRMSDVSFRLMEAAFKVQDTLFPYIDRRVRGFGIEAGMTVVDYGCGPGRYTVRFARLVGPSGRVYALDVQELAVEAVSRRVEREGLANVEAVLLRGYDSGLPAGIADRVCAIDMFFAVRRPGEFLAEAVRLLAPGGLLILDDGHQTRATTHRKLAASGLVEIVEETRDHLKCRAR
jgi:cyclopropane fatty-acyl-phospholipid synthase-like methyltransferase